MFIWASTPRLCRFSHTIPQAIGNGGLALFSYKMSPQKGMAGPNKFPETYSGGAAGLSRMAESHVSVLAPVLSELHAFALISVFNPECGTLRAHMRTTVESFAIYARCLPNSKRNSAGSVYNLTLALWRA
jgi:hypothetical protein